MSIPALNNTTDYDVYFKKYLKSLDLQNELNKKNFDANYAFRTTGVRETERPDMRPLEERMADVEKLKVQARMMLNKVTDSKNTNQVMEYLLQNQKILFYFIQNFPTFEEIVKRQYSGGILATQMISILYRAYQKYSDEILIPDSNDYALVTSLVTKEDLDEIYNRTRNRTLRQAIDDNKQKFLTKADIEKVINSPEKYVKQIKEYADKYQNALTYNDINPLIEAYNDIGIYKPDNSDLTIPSLEDELVLKLDNFVKPDEAVNIPENKFTKSEVLTPAQRASLVTNQQKEQALRTALKGVKRIPTKIDAQAQAQADAQAQAQADAQAQAQADASQGQGDELTEPLKMDGTGFLDNREKSIHRFKVLKGELIAGNTSRSIIKELKSLVVKMIKINELEPPQALMILKELNNIK